MKSLFVTAIFIISCSVGLNADNNESIKEDTKSNLSKEQRTQKQLEVQMKREEKFAREQTFYQGKEHDLGYAKVNPDSIDSVPLIEPEYDFDMDDVYD
jgi:hypothetical protein